MRARPRDQQGTRDCLLPLAIWRLSPRRSGRSNHGPVTGATTDPRGRVVTIRSRCPSSTFETTRSLSSSPPGSAIVLLSTTRARHDRVATVAARLYFVFEHPRPPVTGQLERPGEARLRLTVAVSSLICVRAKIGRWTPRMADLTALLTCPACGKLSSETMPTDCCVFFYECGGCQAVLRPNPGDCCVFYSFAGSVLPPVQVDDCCGR